MAVHGHGDKMSVLRETVPKLDARTIGTTQVKPFDKLYNFGGFTDSDRGAFLAFELGASKIYLAGMDLGSKIGKYSGEKNPKLKIAKLEICGGLLSWLSSNLGAKLANLTSGGKPIRGIPCVKIENQASKAMSG